MTTTGTEVLMQIVRWNPVPSTPCECAYAPADDLRPQPGDAAWAAGVVGSRSLLSISLTKRRELVCSPIVGLRGLQEALRRCEAELTEIPEAGDSTPGWIRSAMHS